MSKISLVLFVWGFLNCSNTITFCYSSTNSVDWLNQNYTVENGLPGFFNAGKYRPSGRNEAEKDYVDTVKLCLASEDDEVRLWAVAMVQTDYLVEDYWRGHTLHENIVDKFYGYEFMKSTQYQFSAESNKPAGMRTTMETRSAKRKHVTITEDDDVLTTYLGESLGTIMKTEASNIVCDKHHGYFKCVGMNNVFDATDHSDGSQLALFDEKQRKVILARILSPPIEHQSTFNKELNGLAQVVQSSKDGKLVLTLMHNYASKAKVADQITAQMHIHTLQLLLWSPELFDVNTLSNLSEGDYVVKFWGLLVELAFCKTGLRPQWGDTVSQLGRKTKPRIKMDLRVLCVASRNNDEQDDVCSGEFAKASGKWKYHKDKAKLVVSAKLLLNQVIKELGSDNANNTRVCMLQSMGLEAEIYSLRLVANGLYVLELHGTLKIPTCIEQYAKSMAELLEKLTLLKELSLKMKSHCELARNKKYKLKTGLSRFTSSSKVTPTVNWTRNIWHNPSLEDDDDDDE